MTTTNEARTILADLEKKAAATRSVIAELNERRAALSFAAHAAADQEATKTLAKLNTDRIAALAKLEELERAIAEARRLIAIAQTGEDEEAQRKRAEEARPIAERLAARGKKLDAAMREYCEHYAAIDADINELVRLGVPVPSRDLVRVNLRRAHDTATSPLDKTSRPVPPTMRRTFDSLLTGWAQPGLNWISGKLKNAAATEAA
jgi:seryl-tRNA synthetase